MDRVTWPPLKLGTTSNFGMDEARNFCCGKHIDHAVLASEIRITPYVGQVRIMLHCSASFCGAFVMYEENAMSLGSH